MAGGTGGHVFPGLAVARRLRAEGNEVLWLGTRQGLEAEIVPKESIPIRYLTITGLRRTDLKTRLLAPFRLFWSLLEALRIVQAFKPDVVLGMGGFVSGPGGMAAWLLRKPLILHEQNAIAGFTNRFLSRFAKRVLEGFPNSFPSKIPACWIGNPVREEFSLVKPPEVRFQVSSQTLRLLILGGSQGARALNELIPKALARISDRLTPNSESLPPIQIWHQTGHQHFESTKMGYEKELGKDVLSNEIKNNDSFSRKIKIEPFIQDMAGAYAWADLVICRAGALTVSELAMVGVGSILVPFPFAVDDHQTHNGHFLEKIGAAQVVPQSLLDSQKCADILLEYLARPEALLSMAIAAKKMAKPRALTELVTQCIEVGSEFKSKDT